MLQRSSMRWDLGPIARHIALAEHRPDIRRRLVEKAVLDGSWKAPVVKKFA
jgi:hypothetical protein